MQFDLQAIGAMVSAIIEQHVPTGHQLQPCASLEEESAGIRQHTALPEGRDPGGAKKDRVHDRCRHLLKRLQVASYGVDGCRFDPGCAAQATPAAVLTSAMNAC